jgi:hypothetical protein
MDITNNNDSSQNSGAQNEGQNPTPETGSQSFERTDNFSESGEDNTTSEAGSSTSDQQRQSQNDDFNTDSNDDNADSYNSSSPSGRE